MGGRAGTGKGQKTALEVTLRERNDGRSAKRREDVWLSRVGH